MRNRRKMETVRIRKANATTEKEKVMYFAQDRDVGTRILAILSVGQTKSGVKKEVIGADGKQQQSSCLKLLATKLFVAPMEKLEQDSIQ